LKTSIGIEHDRDACYESESTDDLEQTGLAQIISKNEIRNVLKPTSIRLLGVSKRYPKDLTLKKVRLNMQIVHSSTLTWSGAVEESIADEDGIHAREVWQSMSSTYITRVLEASHRQRMGFS
jgi:hypothetical protein